MFDELDTVVLTHDIAKYKLKKGDLGTIVHLYSGEKVIEIEFVTATGRTVALVTLKASDVRSTKSNDVLHVRGFAAA